MGGKSAWAESYASWTHFYCEEKFNTAVSIPYVDGAVKGLELALDDAGWLHESTTKHLYPAPAEEKVNEESQVSTSAPEEKIQMTLMEKAEADIKLKDPMTIVSSDTGIEHKIYSSYD